VKYRIRADLIFDRESDAQDLWQKLKSHTGLVKKVVNLDVDKSYIELHLCGHDEAKECSILERIEK